MYDQGTFLFGDRIMDTHVEEARREVRAYRLQRQARGPRGHGTRLFSAAAAGLGTRLARWGAHLQERYGAEPGSRQHARADA